MKNSFFTLLLICITTTLLSQTKTKPVVEINYRSANEIADTVNYYITKIDTAIFKEMLAANNKIALQFWQPWCSGEKAIMPQVKSLKANIKLQGYDLVMISDNHPEYEYYKILDGKVGMIVFYFNKYGLNFPTYIMGENESVEMYQNILSTFLNKKINKNHYCFLLDNKTQLYHNYSYNFYKKYLK